MTGACSRRRTRMPGQRRLLRSSGRRRAPGRSGTGARDGRTRPPPDPASPGSTARLRRLGRAGRQAPAPRRVPATGRRRPGPAPCRVDVEHPHRPAERECEQGARGVGSDAGQRASPFSVSGNWPPWSEPPPLRCGAAPPRAGCNRPCERATTADCGAAAQAATVGNSCRNACQWGRTRAACVCWSMTSEPGPPTGPGCGARAGHGVRPVRGRAAGPRTTPSPRPRCRRAGAEPSLGHVTEPTRLALSMHDDDC